MRDIEARLLTQTTAPSELEEPGLTPVTYFDQHNMIKCGTTGFKAHLQLFKLGDFCGVFPMDKSGLSSHR